MTNARLSEPTLTDFDDGDPFIISNIIKHNAACQVKLQEAGLWTDELQDQQSLAYDELSALLCDEEESIQYRKDKWMRVCFDDAITDSPEERNRRFLEEALETVQAAKMTEDEAHYMVSYVFGRPVGDLPQEVAGAFLTLATLCNLHKIDLMDAAETELARVWTKVDVIRTKQKRKPTLHGDTIYAIGLLTDVEKQLYKTMNPIDLAVVLFHSPLYKSTNLTPWGSVTLAATIIEELNHSTS